MAAVAVLAALLRRCRGLALLACFAFPAALILMEGVLHVRYRRIFAVGQLLEGLEHIIGDAVLASERHKILFAQREFCAFETVRQIGCGCARHSFLLFGYLSK